MAALLEKVVQLLSDIGRCARREAPAAESQPATIIGCGTGKTETVSWMWRQLRFVAPIPASKSTVGPPDPRSRR